VASARRACAHIHTHKHTYKFVFFHTPHIHHIYMYTTHTPRDVRMPDPASSCKHAVFTAHTKTPNAMSAHSMRLDGMLRSAVDMKVNHHRMIQAFIHPGILLAFAVSAQDIPPQVLCESWECSLQRSSKRCKPAAASCTPVLPPAGGAGLQWCWRQHLAPAVPPPPIPWPP
jgi:hypothetical protein